MDRTAYSPPRLLNTEEVALELARHYPRDLWVQRRTVTLPARFQVELPPELRDVEVCEEPPSVSNRAEIAELLTRYYPDYLRESGLDGRAILELVVDAQGQVWSVELAEPSGHLELDEIALTIGSFFEFEPGVETDGP